MRVFRKYAGVLAGVALAASGIVSGAAPAHAAGESGVVCLSIKSATYAYLEAYYLNWSQIKYINRGECSTDEYPGGYLWRWSPAYGYVCVSQWGWKYYDDQIYKAPPGGSTPLRLTCNKRSTW